MSLCAICTVIVMYMCKYGNVAMKLSHTPPNQLAVSYTVSSYYILAFRLSSIKVSKVSVTTDAG